MIDPRVRPGLAAVIFTASIALGSAAAASPQQPEVSGARSPAPQSTTRSSSSQDVDETRREFYEVLKQYPPGLGRVMRLDPTLMTNEAYLAAYPRVAAFIAQNPDVPRNPGYYLEQYDPNFRINEPHDPRQLWLGMWGDAVEFMGAFVVFLAVVFTLFGLLKYVVEQRRWQRVTKMNAEVHNKILDRFGSNQELLAYVESPAGRRFLEARPMARDAAPRSVHAPFGRILLSVQIGILLLALATGLGLIGKNAIEEVQPVLMSLAVLGFCLGVGSIASAGASYLLSRKLGLLPEIAGARPERVD